MKSNSKLLGVAVVAMFCVTAFAVAADSDDSSAASTNDYFVYLVVISEDGKEVSNIGWTHFVAENSPEKYVKGLNDAFNGRYNLVASYSSGESSSISFKYNSSANVATYYLKDKAWAKSTDTVKDYTGSTAVLVIANGYISQEKYNALTDTQKSNWESSGMSGDWAYMRKQVDADATKVPAVTTVHAYVEIMGADHKVSKSAWFEIRTAKDADAFMADFNAAMQAAGGDFKSVNAYGDDTYIHFCYGEGENTACWKNSNNEWKASGGSGAEYYGVDSFAVAVNGGWISEEEYNKLSSDLKSQWVKDESMGSYYMKSPSSGPTDYNKKTSNNTILYIAIAIIAIIAVAGLAFYFMKKKNAVA